jgi:hypothetical protein
MLKWVAIVFTTALLAFAVFLLVMWHRAPHWSSAAAGCINSLRQIQAAKEQWALEQHKTTNDIPTWDDLRPWFREDWQPVCPRTNYTIGRVGEYPTCVIGGPHHTLP